MYVYFMVLVWVYDKKTGQSFKTKKRLNREKSSQEPSPSLTTIE